MTKSVWIILLNFNGTADTLECLDSLRHVDYPNYRVLVVDNGSFVSPAESVRGVYSSAVIIENGTNAGFAEGNNIGIRFALDHGADYVFVLNNDTVAPPDLVKRLVGLAESEPSIGMVCPAIVSYYDRTKTYGPVIDWHWGIGGEWPLDVSDASPREVDFATGCAQLVKAGVARAIGLYDPDYFMYYEDADWSQRCKLAGYRVLIDPGSVLYHKGTPDRVGQKQPSTWYYYVRNQPQFFRRYGKPARAAAISIRHDRHCLTEFQKAWSEGNHVKAEAILSGWVASLFRVYGSRRLTIPIWCLSLVWPFSHMLLAVYAAVDWLERRQVGARVVGAIQGVRRRLPVRTTIRRVFLKR